MKKPLWKFTDEKGSFCSETAHQINTLYFPLCNTSALMSSVSTDLHGDLKTNFNSFLLEPVSRIDLNNLKSSRNFWIYVAPDKIWSATGVSKDILTAKFDEFKLEAGLLWQKIRRQNKRIGLKAGITSFVPATGEPVEIMRIDIANISKKPIKFIPTAAIPIYGRSANNLRDHRHVSSLLNRIEIDKFGVILKPTLLFDESGHRKNYTSYFVFGIDGQSRGPEYIYPTQEEFCGDNSDLEAPRAIFSNILPDEKCNIQGKEALGGLRFKAKVIKPKASFSYIILLGITDGKRKIHSLFRKFNSIEKIERSLNSTKKYWLKQSSESSINTGDSDFNNWFRWVNIQPVLRKIFGCSFLPDFDYGRGGRGWRDLWQDCLSLTLANPKETRAQLINNFSGVRIDGTNATIITDAQSLRSGAGFIADRNNISRVWMDHGAWPLITVLLYIHQTGDINILLEKTAYFRDHLLSRSKEIDTCWRPGYGKELKTKNKKIYRGTILEHLLVENLVQFFNVGPHNYIRLENADWNDGLDMAAEFGESVAFSAMYAQNLISLCDILRKLKKERITLLEELAILLDTLTARPIDYADISKKRAILDNYFRAVKCALSGKTITVPATKLIQDLQKKADCLSEHIRKNAWLEEGFFNGYYNNDKERVEGKIKGTVRMTLSGQVLPIMSGIATREQIKNIFKNAKRHLKHPELGGFRLNSDFKDEQLNLGRAFSFIYGDKENGAFFNHMSVMFGYALYKQGFAQEGYEVFNSIYQMAKDTEKSKIYPGLPEYFNAEGRGMYSYLTGSASWFVLTLLTRVFGVRGEYGDLMLEPKLTAAQFKTTNALSVITSFAGKKIEVQYINPCKKDFGAYLIRKVSFNGKVIAQNTNQPYLLIPRRKFLALAKRHHNFIKVILG